MNSLRIIFLFSIRYLFLRSSILAFLGILGPFSFCHAQHYSRTDSIKVKVNGNWLKNPWVGGHNYVQLSSIDMNFDGIKDLFVFDRTGNKITCYINKGTANAVDYIDSTSKYAPKFPPLVYWALLKDYDGDGKEDIFTYPPGGIAGIAVYKNISTPSTGLQFTLVKPFIESNYCSSAVTNLYVTNIDIPSIEDIDGDGDLDVIAYGFGSSGYPFEYHVNQSVELGYNRDSLIFKLDCSSCWGHFNKPSASACNVNLIACRMMPADSISHYTPPFPLQKTSRNDSVEGGQPPVTLDGGDCSLCLDLNGDGNKDILIGGLGCCKFIALTNTGSPTSANMTSQDDNFPSYNIPVNISTFPCGYYVDVNNDTKRDLIVCPNLPNSSIDNEGLWYYENMGTDNAPVFSRQTRSLLQQDMIDVGSGADPIFFDFDSDGLTDLLISNYSMTQDSCPTSYSNGVWAFKNIGTPSYPKFNLVSTDYANLISQLPPQSQASKHLTFGDIDHDGDTDMFVGDYNGYVSYFQNTAGAGNPANFVYMGLVRDAATPNDTFIDVGSYSTPQLIDVDRDGKLDLIIGEGSGNLNYYRNTGTPTAPIFSFITSSFGGVDVLKGCCTGYSVPFMYDSAGSYRLLVASEANRSFTQGPVEGWIWYYKDIDGNLTGNFTCIDSMYQRIWEGLRMTVNGKDINNDGRLDLVIGNFCGGVAIYMGDTLTTAISEINAPPFDFSIYPNPSSGQIQFNVQCLGFKFGKMEFQIFDMLGNKVYSQTLSKEQGTLNLGLRSGVYSCVVTKDKFSKTKKIVVLK